MAEFVGSFASSHGPLIAREWERMKAPLRQQLDTAFSELGRRLNAAHADTIIVISPDHWVNFFLDNLPNVCIGVGAENLGPPEPFMQPFPHRTLANDVGLAQHILESALSSGFEPSISHRLTLDHGFCIPLWRSGLNPMPRILPIVVNDIEPPMISMVRALQWGGLLRRAIESYPENIRVAVLATGGLSHSIGEAGMGRIDETFDRKVISLFEAGNPEMLAAHLEPALKATGNGAHETRNWLVAQGAARNSKFQLIDYFPAPDIYIGAAFAYWCA